MVIIGLFTQGRSMWDIDALSYGSLVDEVRQRSDGGNGRCVCFEDKKDSAL